MSYVTPEGWHPGLPVVRVSPQVIDLLGEATVNYGALEAMYRDSLELNPYQVPRTVFKQRSRNGEGEAEPGDVTRFGRYAFYRNTSYIDPVAIAAEAPPQDALTLLTQTIIHQGLLCRDWHGSRGIAAIISGSDRDSTAHAVASSASVLQEFGHIVKFAALDSPQ